MVDGIDFALTIRYDLQHMLGKRLPIRLYTDSHSFFDVIQETRQQLKNV